MPTTGISLIREQTEAMRLPRFLWVPFELGRPFGAPNEPSFQRRVLRAALDLLDRSDGPVVLEDFPDDAPATDEQVVWTCPVSFGPGTVEESDPVAAVRAEIGQLAAWAELSPAPALNSSMSLDELVVFLGAAAAGEDTAGYTGDQPAVEALRLAADDLRTWYLHAVARQPGAATTAERMTWFWEQTALGRLLGELAARLLASPDPLTRLFADRGLVPRDHWAIVPERRSAELPESPTPTGTSDD